MCYSINLKYVFNTCIWYIIKDALQHGLMLFNHLLQCEFVQLVINGVRKMIEMEEALEKGENIDELVANAASVKVLFNLS